MTGPGSWELHRCLRKSNPPPSLHGFGPDLQVTRKRKPDSVNFDLQIPEGVGVHPAPLVWVLNHLVSMPNIASLEHQRITTMTKYLKEIKSIQHGFAENYFLSTWLKR